MADTARDIITEALIDLTVLDAGEPLAAVDAAFGLKKLNGMLDLMGLDNQLVYGMTRNILTTTVDKTVYTIGTGGDLDIPRPNEILSAYYFDTTTDLANRADYPLQIYNDQEWASQTFKTWTGTFPAFGIYFDYQFPFINAYLNPTPLSNQYSIALYTKGMLGNLALDDIMMFPPGYRTLIVSNLAIELSGSYQVAVPASVQLAATKSQNLISSKNLQVNELLTYGSGYYYDMRSNRWRPGGSS